MVQQGRMGACPFPLRTPEPAVLTYPLFLSKMKCGNCGEISDKWQYIRQMVTVPTSLHTSPPHTHWSSAESPNPREALGGVSAACPKIMFWQVPPALEAWL